MVSYISFMCQSSHSGGDTYAYGSICTYLTAIANLHAQAGLPNPTTTIRVKRAKVAAKKFCKENGRVRRKWPLSAVHIRKWKRTLDFSVFNCKIFYAVALLAFCGLHRVSELAYTTGALEYRGLRRGNIMFSPRDEFVNGFPAYVAVNLEHAKADTTWRYGGKAKYFQSGTELCVVKALWSVFEFDTRPAHAPLFVVHNRKNALVPLARHHVSHFVKQIAAISGLPIGNFDTHSFRAGGACALWAAGYSADTIRILGRWASNCWLIYVTQADSRIKSVTRDMFMAVTSSVFYARIHDMLRVDPLEPQPLGT